MMTSVKQEQQQEEFLCAVEERFEKIPFQVSYTKFRRMADCTKSNPKSFRVIRNAWRYLCANEAKTVRDSLEKILTVIESEFNHPGFNWEMVLKIIGLKIHGAEK
jgi:hypothetical protein